MRDADEVGRFRMLGVNPRRDDGSPDHGFAVLLVAVLGREKVSACVSPTDKRGLCLPIGGWSELRWLRRPEGKSGPVASLTPSLRVSSSVTRLLITLLPSCSSSTSASESGRL